MIARHCPSVCLRLQERYMTDRGVAGAPIVHPVIFMTYMQLRDFNNTRGVPAQVRGRVGGLASRRRASLPRPCSLARRPLARPPARPSVHEPE